MKSGIKPHLFTIISAIVVLAILSFIFLSYSTATIFNQAELAYLSGDWSTSVELFNKIRNRYPLSFPDRSEEVSYYLDGANMLIAAQEMETNKAYEEALSIYKDFLINHKDEYYHFSISSKEFSDYKNLVTLLYETHEYEKIPDTYTTMENKYGKNSYFNNIDFIEQDYPKMYYEWGKYLWDNDNFSDANKKFHKILGTYDQSTYAYEAQTDIQNLYLDWATYLADHQDYENAFAHLDDIQSKWPLSQASDLSNDLYFEIGFKYAKELHNDSKFEEEVEIIENLIKKFPLSSQIDVLYETQQAAYIAYANQKLANDQFFDAISFLELAKKYASDEETIEGINERISEANHAILFDQGEEGKLIIKSIISAVCNTGAELPEIVNLIPNDASKIALCGYSTYKPDPDSLADSLGEMKYIVDINDETKTIENCPYEGMNNLIRRQKYIEIVIYDAKSGKRIKSHTVFGKMPEQCPDYYTFTHDQFSILGVTDSLYGADVDKQDVDDWLTGYLPK